MANAATITESEILSSLVAPNQPGLPPELARAIFTISFDEQATIRINDLAEKNRLGTISNEEAATLKNYIRVGNFLNLLRAKAGVSLANGAG